MIHAWLSAGASPCNSDREQTLALEVEQPAPQLQSERINRALLRLVVRRDDARGGSARLTHRSLKIFIRYVRERLCQSDDCCLEMPRSASVAGPPVGRSDR